MDAPMNDVLKKLAALKELNERASTPGEAAAAAAGMSRLLFRYNLTMADVVDKATLDDPITNSRFSIKRPFGNGSNLWKGILLQATANAYFCRAVLTGDMSYALVGKQSNVAVAQSMFEYLYDTAKRICKAQWKVAAVFIDGMKEKQFKDSFYLGYATTVVDRLVKERKEQETEAGAKGSALVVKLDAMVDAAFKAAYPLAMRKQAKGPGGVSQYAMQLGANAGKGVSLNKQVGSSSSIKSLKK